MSLRGINDGVWFDLHQIEVAASHLRSRRRVADVLGGEELPAVEEPRHGRVAIGILPENVIPTVAVEVPSAQHGKARIGGANVLDGSDMAARHQPSGDMAVVTP